MSAPNFRPEKKVIVASVVAVAATYTYFLLFAQFGFLKALEGTVGEEQGVIKVVLTLMGLSGICGSVFASRFFTDLRSKRTVIVGFALSAVAAAGSIEVETREFYYPVALLVGLGTGLTTVTLASLLGKVVGDRLLGRVIGTGTGVAYGFCNLPAIFEATPAVQAWVSVGIAAAGALAAIGLNSGTIRSLPLSFDYSKWGIWLWVALFFALVSFDSAAFYIIQHTPALKNDTWVGSWQLGFNAGVHLIAAMLAGYLLDRQWLGRLVSVAVMFLLAASLSVGRYEPAFPTVGFWYAAGVSVYSVAFVFYAASSGRPKVAALIYGVAGWGGSAVGVGLAENRHIVPAWFIAVTGAVVFAVLGIRLVLNGKLPAD